MIDEKELQEGWNFAVRLMEADRSAAVEEDYVRTVSEAISELEKAINEHPYKNLNPAQLKGYMQEEWAAQTFNVDAAAARSSDRAAVLHSLEKNSVHIHLNSADDYTAKAYADAEKSVKQQAEINPITRQPRYDGQKRLIPTDQLEEGKNIAHREMLKNQENRPDMSEAYKQVEEKLTDVVENENGVRSRPAAKQELEEMARESKNNSFNAEDHDVTLDTAIRNSYVLREAAKAGVSAAAVSVALELVPEICKAVSCLVREGRMDAKQIRQIGEKGLQGAAQGFLHGFIAAGLLIECRKGSLGTELLNVSAEALGYVTAIVLRTIQTAVQMAAGRKSARQMGDDFVNTLLVVGGISMARNTLGTISAAALKAASKATENEMFIHALGITFSAAGLVLGSLAGAVLCVLYEIGKRKAISLCVDTGFTCFGLVEQDYELPDEVLTQLGIETIPLLTMEPDRVKIERFQPDRVELDRIELETVDFVVLRRGIMGVNRVGYVLS